MNTNCLVTKLKGQVNNSNLDKLGVLKLRASVIESFTSSKSALNLNVNGDVTITIVGNGYLSTSFDNLPSSTEKSITLTALSHPTVYFSNGNYDVEISNKYAIVGISASSSVIKIDNVEQLKSLNNLTTLTISHNELSGDINDISHLTGSVNYNKLTGDITNFANASLPFRENYCYGDFTNILSISTSSTELNSLRGNGKEGKVSTIDVSKAPSNITLLSASGFHTQLNASWTSERSSSCNIIALEGGNIWDFGEYLDAMLINQAQCDLVSGATGVNATINVYGNRTSASDAAVATLKGKGVTVKINGKML